MTTVGVVVCCYTFDRWDAVHRALKSIAEQSRPADAVVLVVDHEPELYAAAQVAFPTVRVVENRAPARGVAGARNTGVEELTTDVVAFLDDDAVAPIEWLECLLPAFADPQLLGIDSRLVPAWEDDPPRWFPSELLWVVGCSYTGLPERRAEVRNLIGAAMVMRRCVFTSTGGFRTELGRVGRIPVGCEETELSIRARVEFPGARFEHDPEVAVEHAVPRRRATWSYLVSRCWSEGRSKAFVTALSDTRRGLASEWTYTTRVVPRGIARYVVHGELARATALVVGVSCTAAGYGFALVAERRTRRALSTR